MITIAKRETKIKRTYFSDIKIGDFFEDNNSLHLKIDNYNAFLISSELEIKHYINFKDDQVVFPVNVNINYEVITK